MAFSWVEIWIGLFLVICLVALAIKTSKKFSFPVDDQKILQSVKETLEEDFIEHYEISSIIPLAEKNSTTVIVNTDSIDFALEIDNISGRIISKEKLIR